MSKNEMSITLNAIVNSDDAEEIEKVSGELGEVAHSLAQLGFQISVSWVPLNDSESLDG